MNKNLIFRILGIVGGALIIISLFLPYVNVTGFSQSLWRTYIENKQIYLAIIIILFGLLPIVLNSINKKMEFTYMSVGALLFFVIIQVLDTVSSGTFKTLSIGFYMLLFGTVFIAVSTFLLDKFSKINILDEQVSSMSNNISDPMQSGGVDAVISESSNDLTNIKNDNEGEFINPDESSKLDDKNDDLLGEEIPEYQPEDGVNPVISEFTNPESENKSDDSPEQPEEVQESEQSEPTQEELVAPEQTESTQEELAAPEQSIPVPEELGTLEQPEEVQESEQSEPTQEESVAPEQSLPNAEESIQNSIMPQPEISFDDSEKSDVSDEPQFDVFGQPK